MTGINTISGTAAPLDQANIDTDQIIPKQFLTGVTRSGYGINLFHDWRYLPGPEKKPDPDFPLNDAKFKGASILLTRENFGCGSSREHAPWALADYGFRAIIATSFADIFYGNSINNQLLPICLNNAQIDQLIAKVNANANSDIYIDLPTQQVTCEELSFNFDIAPHHKNNLLKGLDAIGQTLELDNKISAYENNRPQWL
ncbi:3-isopropylmalate dehydratase small subunit [Glaciecola petra]|uniref:3-isopropylmalate dehydratase small subunit n=1 Tax=Glaciecola petra TaxID=3075602 RepID=A0ABU2ZU30_9ALTE|nr:3-isopropylmalate dehydratase small subunit [Aestuariibacter sp. P117]MDT0595911.1 3-isopropylmalate dehydratase small subunit [Aestuariibacter sp. P117]